MICPTRGTAWDGIGPERSKGSAQGLNKSVLQPCPC